jgi:hypothetical protein
MFIMALRGRRTQVAKGEVCKTSMQRFKSARRLQEVTLSPRGAAVFTGGDSVIPAGSVAAPEVAPIISAVHIPGLYA